MELLDIYRGDHQRAGRTIPRNGDVLAGEYLLIVHVCLFNAQGEMLIQKRQSTKDRYPGIWDVSAGGFVASGEESLAAVLREAKEEVGVTLAADSVQFLCTEPFSYVLDDFFVALCDRPAEEFHIQYEEVSEVKWASREDVMSMLDNGTFVDYDRSLLLRCFDAGGKYE